MKNKRIRHISELDERDVLFSVIAGSNSYGTALSTSDIDIRGVCYVPVDPVEMIVSPETAFVDEYRSDKNDEGDIKFFNLSKFIKLARGCNPGIIELLYSRENDIIQIKSGGRLLMQNRHLFLTALARWTFVGYARAQIDRMETDFKMKHAMHLIRLLRMGVEILTEGVVHVHREDRDELLDIRNGRWSYDKIMAEADDMEMRIKEIYDKKVYVVPEEIDNDKIKKIIGQIVKV